MNVRSVALNRGVGWYADGWRAFVNAPGLMIGLLLLWFIGFIALEMVPLVGGLVVLIITPAIYAGYLYVCLTAVAGEQPRAEQLFTALSDPDIRSGMLILGVLFLVAQLLMLFLSVIITILMALLLLGALPAGIEELPPQAILANPELLVLILLILVTVLLLLTLIVMGFTYAAPLVLQQRSPPMTAIQLSFSGCLRNILPLSVFGLLFLLLFIIAVIPLGLGLLVLMPVTFAALAVSYRDIFPAEQNGEGARYGVPER